MVILFVTLRFVSLTLPTEIISLFSVGFDICKCDIVVKALLYPVTQYPVETNREDKKRQGQ